MIDSMKPEIATIFADALSEEVNVLLENLAGMRD